MAVCEIGEARVFQTPNQVLDLIAPKGATLEKKSIFLSDTQKSTIEKKIKAKIDSKLIAAVKIMHDKKLYATAYIDTHVVRKETETLLVVIKPDHTIARVEILSFNEPQDYLASGIWLKQFSDMRIESAHTKNAGVQGILGATLTSNAIIQSVQKVVAISELNL
ncbi:MAG: FMN-binding protein [Deltaproteobacteria bacterium]|nr:FMN-binding protein [Deltaproteobacteria bacterium]